MLRELSATTAKRFAPGFARCPDHIGSSKHASNNAAPAIFNKAQPSLSPRPAGVVRYDQPTRIRNMPKAHAAGINHSRPARKMDAVHALFAANNSIWLMILSGLPIPLYCALRPRFS
jgi:hypothetical protein